MKNRAKCKKCNSIIESFHSTDYVMCQCGEISVYEGDALKCAAKDYSNFIRVDENGNEIIVKVVDRESNTNPDTIAQSPKPTRTDMLDMLDEMIRNVEKMPSHALQQPINHYDYLSLMLLLSSLLRARD
jgi:hypothetical protein